LTGSNADDYDLLESPSMIARAIPACLAVLAATAAVEPRQASDEAAQIKQIEAWRTKHEADFRREWVSISGLFFLKPGANAVGSAASNDIVLEAAVPATIGRFVLAEDGAVSFEPAPGVDVRLKDQPVTAPRVLTSDEPGPADEVIVNGVKLSVHMSGERRSIRTRDDNGAPARAFTGFSWFPIDLRHRVVGRFIRDAAPRRLRMLNTLGDMDEATTEGVVEFRLLGKTLRLRPMTTRPKRFWFIFRDVSSGHETYEAARFLYADLADDGTSVLDFNEAYNPPCAFNPYTTCPIPLPENRLTVKILAGEKAYRASP
jgi:uncharacterized protein